MNLHPKVSAAAIAGAVSIIIVFVLTLLGVPVDPTVAQAITTVLSLAAGYLKGVEPEADSGL